MVQVFLFFFPSSRFCYWVLSRAFILFLQCLPFILKGKGVLENVCTQHDTKGHFFSWISAM